MLKEFKQGTLNTVGFVLHSVQFHKPTGAFMMEYGEKFFWVWMFLFVTSIVSNFFIA